MAKRKSTIIQKTCLQCRKILTGRKKEAHIYCSNQCYWKHRGQMYKPPTKKCNKCGILQPFTNEYFGAHRRIKNSGLVSTCKKCLNTEAKKKGPGDRLKLKTELLTAYGNGTLACVCCKENHIEFLTLDHINGGGTTERKAQGGSVKLHRKLRREGYPQGNYRTLCFNCNWAYGIYGYCPHQLIRKKDTK